MDCSCPRNGTQSTNGFGTFASTSELFLGIVQEGDNLLVTGLEIDKFQSNCILVLFGDTKEGALFIVFSGQLVKAEFGFCETGRQGDNLLMLNLVLFFLSF